MSKLFTGIVSQIFSQGGEAEITDTAATDNPNSASYTFTGLNFGATDPNRLLIVCVSGCLSKAGTITSATLGGQTMSGSALHANGVAEDTFAFVAETTTDPSGTSGDFAISFSGGGQRIRGISITVIRTVGYSFESGEFASITGTTTPSKTMTNAANGILLGACATDAASTGIAWTLMTENQEVSHTLSDEAQATKLSGVAGGDTVGATISNGTADAVVFVARAYKLD